MFPTHCQKLYTPPSSPDSLCVAWPNSSSPPSPRSEPFNLNYDEDEEAPMTRLIHPLAGSYNANRTKRASEASPARHSPKKPRRLYQLSDFQETVSSSTDPTYTPSLIDSDSSTWEEALLKVFDTGIRSIDLSGCNLTSIPGWIVSDLGKVVVLPETRETSDDSRLRMSSIRPINKPRAFTRFQTAPATTGIAWGSSAMRNKSASSNQILSGASRDHIDLYLGNNNITKLPSELWTLCNLRILSLRNNGIAYLPPEVRSLENLVDLNVALNKLRFLPCELNDIKSLTRLIVLPNPFLSESRGDPSRISKTRQIGSSVPPLTELALRVLLSPKPLSKRRTFLEESYELPIATGPTFCPISGPLQHILATCVPGSITLDEAVNVLSKSDESDNVTGIGLCPNPAHDTKGSVFIHHVEERFTWVDCIAGIKLGGYAPLRWRGCERGCLAFLDPAMEEDENVHDSGINVDDAGIIQTVSFSTAVLDFDD